MAAARATANTAGWPSLAREPAAFAPLLVPLVLAVALVAALMEVVLGVALAAVAGGGALLFTTGIIAPVLLLLLPALVGAAPMSSRYLAAAHEAEVLRPMQAPMEP